MSEVIDWDGENVILRPEAKVVRTRRSEATQIDRTSFVTYESLLREKQGDSSSVGGLI